MQKEKILNVPTNVITGFLGVGKTSAIMHLLKQKPKAERWAILVNEFGEIGVDGSLLESQTLNDNGVFIKEVPGGCMCCASGVPMQIALNQLLKEARPNRLLIEPTGLGHPKEVLHVLTNDVYKNTLKLEKTVTLVDARNLKDSRYTSHETFNQQLEIADVIVGNKADLYKTQDKQELSNYLNNKGYTPEATHFTELGALKLMWLAGSNEIEVNQPTCSHHHDHEHQPHVENQSVSFDQTKQAKTMEQALPEYGVITAVNQGETYNSVGWRFSNSHHFNRIALKAFLLSVSAIRIKAVFVCVDGIYSYNLSNDGFNETSLVQANESRIEVICDQVDDNWDIKLKQCLHKALA